MEIIMHMYNFYDKDTELIILCYFIVSYRSIFLKENTNVA